MPGDKTEKTERHKLLSAQDMLTFLLANPRADKSIWRSVFSFKLWYGGSLNKKGCFL